MPHFQAAGFSEEVSRLSTAHRRPSTNRMYNNSWLRFANWAEHRIDPFGPTGKAEVMQDRIISDLVSSMELERPSLGQSCQNVIWALFCRSWLNLPPCGPLQKASSKHLTCKTVFPLRMASAGGRSELQALVAPWVLVLHFILFLIACIRIRDLPKLTIPGTYQLSLQGS